MNNPQTTTEPAIAIVHNTNTVSVTFVEKPNDRQRQQLRDAGFLYQNGTWFKSVKQGFHADESLVAQLVAA